MGGGWCGGWWGSWLVGGGWWVVVGGVGGGWLVFVVLLRFCIVVGVEGLLGLVVGVDVLLVKFCCRMVNFVGDGDCW